MQKTGVLRAVVESRSLAKYTIFFLVKSSYCFPLFSPCKLLPPIRKKNNGKKKLLAGKPSGKAQFVGSVTVLDRSFHTGFVDYNTLLIGAFFTWISLV